MNAARHGLPKGPILVEASRIAGVFQVQVHNDGPGIEPAIIPLLMQPFALGAAGFSPERRFGLGLFIVDAIVRAHGGSVTISSSDAAGTSFTLHLPEA